MTLADLLGLQVRFRVALAFVIFVALITSLITTRKAIPKLHGAGVVGHDKHKQGNPEVAEMGGLAVFLAFNVGAFTALGFGELPTDDEVLLLASLVVAAGGAIAGALDDLIGLRQRFKAVIPFAFAAPLALYVSDTAIFFPFVGTVDFGLVYPLVLVPLGVACASNGFNMLEGFNGLGAGLGIVIAGTLSVLMIVSGRIAGLALTFPLIGALGGFLWFNVYPARVFPGDTMTLMVGAVIAAAAIVSRLEFWGAVLLVPHVVEFFTKYLKEFPSSEWGGRLTDDGRLVSEREDPVGLAQYVLNATGGVSEPLLFGIFVWAFSVLGMLVVGGFLLWG
jgi:UDP-N-acetylglucosamine--dolichyl-phosphate N-acetylglucosaminephosphotransferase